jgi:hypothetical protein
LKLNPFFLKRSESTGIPPEGLEEGERALENLRDEVYRKKNLHTGEGRFFTGRISIRIP